jgi:hypothetical protein
MQRSRRTQKVDRKYERFQLDVRLIVRTKTDTLHGRTKNLAEGGMGATVAGDIQLQELVELQFQLPEVADPLVLRAEVRYRQGFQYGFRFIPPTEEQAEMIRQGVRDLEPDE